MLLLPVTVTYTYTGVGQDRAGLYSRVQISFDFFWSRFVLTRRNTARALPPRGYSGVLPNSGTWPRAEAVPSRQFSRGSWCTGDVWAINVVFLSALSLSKSSTGETAARVGARRWRCEPMGASGTWGRRTSRAERTTAPSERRMWLLKDRMSLAMPEALAHANLWEAKVRNLAWSEVLPPER